MGESQVPCQNCLYKILQSGITLCCKTQTLSGGKQALWSGWSQGGIQAYSSGSFGTKHFIGWVEEEGRGLAYQVRILGSYWSEYTGWLINLLLIFGAIFLRSQRSYRKSKICYGKLLLLSSIYVLWSALLEFWKEEKNGVFRGQCCGDFWLPPSLGCSVCQSVSFNGQEDEEDRYSLLIIYVFVSFYPDPLNWLELLLKINQNLWFSNLLELQRNLSLSMQIQTTKQLTI